MSLTWTRFLPAAIRAKISGREYLQNALGNAGVFMADSVFRMAIGLVVGVWVARYLGPERYGQLSYVTAFVALFAPLASFGLDDILLRNVVRDPECKDLTLGTCFVLRLAGGVVTFAAIIGCVVAFRLAGDTSIWLVTIVAAGTLFQAFATFENWFYSQVQLKAIIAAKTTAYLIYCAVKIALIVGKAPLIAFAWVALAEIATGALFLVLVYRLRGNRLDRWRFTGEKARELLRDSWPLMFSAAVMMVYMRIDQVMLGRMAGNDEVGVYSAAVRLGEVWFFIPQIAFSSLLPSIVAAKGVSDELFYQRLQKLYNLMALINYLVAVPVALSADFLVVRLFGAQFQRAGLMLAVLVWGNLFSSLELARSSFLTTMNWTRVHLVTLALGALCNVALNLVLIPRYGGVGAAVASCISYWCAAHGACFLYPPLRRTGWMLSRALVYPKVW